MQKNPFEHQPHAHVLAADEVIRRRVKGELRKRMRGLRHTTPAAACAARSVRIEERLEAHPRFVAARAVALFWPMLERHEVDLRALDGRLRARGVATYYPHIDPETNAMTFRRVDDVAELEEAGRGFAEPKATAPEAAAGALDAIVVPAVALAPDGHRLGYGAGYYDRALPRYAPPAVTFGVAYDFQLLAEIPITEGDVPLDVVITDARTYDVEAAR